jgi:hypothetical protein
MKLLDWCQERHVAQIEKGESTWCDRSILSLDAACAEVPARVRHPPASPLIIVMAL